MYKGKIKNYLSNEGHGLIEPSDRSKDVFFNDNVVKGGTGWLAKGARVKYELYAKGGTPQAKLVIADPSVTSRARELMLELYYAFTSRFLGTSR